MKKKSVLVVGSANMDMVVTMNRFPNPGETLMGSQFGMYPGGKGANQAVACAKLGVKTIFIGKMGNDLFKDRLVANMEANGVIMNELLTDPTEPTGIAMIYVNSNGQNEIVVASGSNMKLTPEDIQTKADLFIEAGIVLSQLELPLSSVQEAARITRKYQGVFILDPAPAVKLPSELMRNVDYLTPNELELAVLTGQKIHDLNSAVQAGRALITSGVRNVIVTLGSQGALWINNSGENHYPGQAVKVVDSTAAGDAFNGAFAYSLAIGKSVPHAISFANRVAAFSITRLGAQPSMPTLNELEENTL